MSTEPRHLTTLESLQRHSSSQEDIIRSLSEHPAEYYFRAFNDENWEAFWKEAWGREPDSLDSLEGFERGPNPVDNSTFPLGAAPTHRQVMVAPEITNHLWTINPGYKKILIRSEYKEAEQFALSTCDTASDVLAVTGQPGIGKSIFLLRILLRRLALKLPTALQIRPNQALLFHEAGVKEFQKLDSAAHYRSLTPDRGFSSRIWALVDSNSGIQAPLPVFRGGPFFVIEATSPRPARREWTRKVKSCFFYMKLWTFAEVLQVRSLVDPDMGEEKLSNLYHKYGASTRDLFNFQPDSYESVVDEEINKLSPDDCTRLFKSIDNTTTQSHFLISTGPLPTDRTRPERRAASEYVLGKILNQVYSNHIEKIKKFYDALLLNLSTAGAAGMIYERQVHYLLQEEGVINLLPIRYDPVDRGTNVIYKDYSATDSAKIRVALPKSRELRFDEPPTSLELGTYYIPRNTNVPTIDSLLLVQPNSQEPPILLAFQMTVGDKHDTKKIGLDIVDKVVAGVRDIKKYLVIVTPGGMRPKITVPRTYLTEEFLNGRNPDDVFPVYHLQHDF